MEKPIKIYNFFESLPADAEVEHFETLLQGEGGPFRLQRIVSTGQATEPGVWYDQPDEEWVLLLTGSAQLKFEGEDHVRHLRPGDYVQIPAHTRHRVEATDQEVPSIWLALHYDEPGE